MPPVMSVLSKIRSKKRYVLLFVGLVGVLGVVVFFLTGGLSKLPSKLHEIAQKKPAVELKTAYKNPFDKKTQYVNPFETYKNPFVTNR